MIGTERHASRLGACLLAGTKNYSIRYVNTVCRASFLSLLLGRPPSRAASLLRRLAGAQCTKAGALAHLSMAVKCSRMSAP